MHIRILGLIAVSVATLISGCSSTPTLGEQMAAASNESAAIAEGWNRGHELLSKGQKLVEKGKDRVEDGNEMIDDGNDKIVDGRKLIDKGHDAIARGEDEQQRGAEMVRSGQAMMDGAESSYAERHPEIYRQLTKPASK